MKSGILILIVLICLVTFGCDNPNRPGTADAWQKSMRQGIVPGYTNFVAHWLDSDIAAYIFSYTCPDPVSGSEVFTLLQKQIQEFGLNGRTDTTLVMKRPLSYSGPGGFDEWRFIYDKETRVMTVLFANLDSAVERKAHGFIMAKLKQYHDEEVGKQKKR